MKCDRTQDRFYTHEIDMGSSAVTFQWLGGPVFETHKLYRKVMEGVGLVVYVITTTEPVGQTDQEEDLQGYISAAVDCNKTWDHVPWLFVLNKIDLGIRNPILHNIPENQRADIIPCCARDGRGIQTLWTSLLNRL